MHDDRPDTLPNREARRTRLRTIRRRSARQGTGNGLCLENALRRRCRHLRYAGREFRRRHDTVAKQQPLQPLDPDLVVCGAVVVCGMERLARMAAFVEGPVPHGAGTERKREGSPFPFGMEDGLVRFRSDRPEPHLATEVLRTVHDATPSGDRAKPVPIIESRVTSSTS